MINSRKLEDLTPKLARLCQTFIDNCQAAGTDVIITSTYRDNESQDAIYAQGRTTPGSKITNCPGGESMHNYRVAFDFVPTDSKGKPVWGDALLWAKCGKIGEDLGLEWGGSWKSFKDKPHFQIPGLTIAELKRISTTRVLAN